MVTTIIIICLFVTLATFMVIVCRDKNEVPANNGNVICMIVLLVTVLACGIASYRDGRSTALEAFAREVDLQQVSVKGQNNFQAQVQMVYKDGELASVLLVPKTTAAAAKSESEQPKK